MIGARYVSRENVRWLADNDRVVIVVDEGPPAAHVLEGAEAVVWRLLALSYGPERLVDVLQRVLASTTVEAEEALRATLDRLTALGVLERVEEAVRG